MSGWRACRSASRGSSHFCRKELVGVTVLPQPVQGGFELVQAPADAREQARPFRRELNVAPAAAEERGLKVVLQRPDLLADGCGGDVEGLCGLPKIQPLGDGLEDPERIQGQAVMGGAQGDSTFAHDSARIRGAICRRFYA
jgi:hypothetical protein